MTQTMLIPIAKTEETSSDLSAYDISLWFLETEILSRYCVRSARCMHTQKTHSPVFVGIVRNDSLLIMQELNDRQAEHAPTQGLFI